MNSITIIFVLCGNERTELRGVIWFPDKLYIISFHLECNKEMLCYDTIEQDALFVYLLYEMALYINQNL